MRGARRSPQRRLDCQYLDGVVLRRLARFDDAAARFRQASIVAPDYLPARVALAETLFEAGRIDDSRRLFESSDCRAARRASRRALARPNRRGRGAVTISPSRTSSARWRSSPSSAPPTTRSRCRIAPQGRTEDAQRALAQHGAVRIAVAGARRSGTRRAWPRSETTGPRSCGEAWRSRNAGDVTGAIAAHEAALARDPSLAQAHVNLISLYGRAGTVPEGGGALSGRHHRRVRISARHTTIMACCSACRRSGNWPADAYRKALALNPANAQARNNLGQVLERQRQFEAAADEYRQAVESQPTFRLARFNLGRMLLALGRNEDGHRRAEQAVATAGRRDRHDTCLRSRPRMCAPDTRTRASSGRSKPGASRFEYGQTGARRDHRPGARKAEMKQLSAVSFQLSASLSAVLAGCVLLGASQAPPPHRRSSSKRPPSRASRSRTSAVPAASTTWPSRWAPASRSSTTTATAISTSFSFRAAALAEKPAPGAPTSRLFRNDLTVGADGSRKLQFTDVTDKAGMGCADLRHGRRDRRLRQRRRSRPGRHLLRSRDALSQQRQRHVHRRDAGGRRRRRAVERQRRLRRLRPRRRSRSLRRQLPRLHGRRQQAVQRRARRARLLQPARLSAGA